MIKLRSLLLEKKINRIFRIIEQRILENKINLTTRDFVIDADGKVFPIDNDMFHGSVVLAYPDLHDKALKQFGSDGFIQSNAEDGTPEIYKIIHDAGFCRGGIYKEGGIWVSFNEKVSQKALMSVLQLLKEKNKKTLSVDYVKSSGGSVYTNEMSIDDFISDYM